MPAVPTPTPSGPYSRPPYVLAQMLAASATFRVRCGLAADDAAAEQKLLYGNGDKQRIHYPALEEQTKLFTEGLPAAVIMDGDEWGWEQFSGGAENFLRPTGELILILADDDRYQGDINSSRIDFGNFFGNTLLDIAGVAAEDTNLAIAAIRQLHRPTMCSEAEERSRGRAYWWGSVTVTWDI